ncbi:hypothetical protein C7972_101180 [Arenibacter sp. ARW7G5Y1]|nr:hypothetical protein C7972_101180 [Arenibacter sp. ARW7G5Y1]
MLVEVGNLDYSFFNHPFITCKELLYCCPNRGPTNYKIYSDEKETKRGIEKIIN